MSRLTDEQIRARYIALLELESSNSMGIHWLSFCDPKKPEGSRFLGVLVVRERGFTSALQFTHRVGLNPGGEVQGYELPSDPRFESILSGSFNRLLSRPEALRLNGLLEAAGMGGE
jgi:hypothetical protein